MPKSDFKKVALQLFEITIWHGCFPVNLLHIFRTPFYKNVSGFLYPLRYPKIPSFLTFS